MKRTQTPVNTRKGGATRKATSGNLLLRFVRHLDAPHVNGSFSGPHGPLFHRWLPDGPRHARQLPTDDPNAEITVWFKRYGFNNAGLITFSLDHNDVDPDRLSRQGVVAAGPLFGTIRLSNVTRAEALALSRNLIDSQVYKAFGKRVIRILQPPLNSFLGVLREHFGQYWIPNIETWDSRRESIGNYCSSLQLQWSSDNGASWTPFRPTANIISLTASLASPETFREFMTEQDWTDLPGLLGSGFMSSVALKTLVTAYAALDHGQLRNALIEGVTVADLTVSEVVRRGVAPSNRNSIGAFLNLPISSRLVVVTGTSGVTALDLLDNALAAIVVRNKVVHEGWWPKDDGRRMEIERSLRSLLKLCALLLGNPIKFPQADVGNRTMI
jgi:hypothetical protein